MARDFPQVGWDAATRDECQLLVRLAIQEDATDSHDWTSESLIEAVRSTQAHVVARTAGVLAGESCVQLVLQELQADVAWRPEHRDRDVVGPGTRLGTLSGNARSILRAERLVLNFLGHLGGIASLTHQFVKAVRPYGARIYDTRKTLPGWRRLQKYAVACGGGRNHRMGLSDAIMVKDNHLAMAALVDRPATAVQQIKQFMRQADAPEDLIVQIELDSLVPLLEVLQAGPDLILLDNMSPDQLRQAVQLRDGLGVDIELEASGGITLQTVKQIAASGVDRISVGALTHSAMGWDVGLDWE